MSTRRASRDVDDVSARHRDLAFVKDTGRWKQTMGGSGPKECPAASVATFTGDCMGASMNTSQLHNDDRRLRSATGDGGRREHVTHRPDFMT